MIYLLLTHTIHITYKVIPIQIISQLKFVKINFYLLINYLCKFKNYSIYQQFEKLFKIYNLVPYKIIIIILYYNNLWKSAIILGYKVLIKIIFIIKRYWIVIQYNITIYYNRISENLFSKYVVGTYLPT